MSTVYQSTKNVKQYAEIESTSSGGVNSMKKFMIIVDHDRINNPMIKYQEG
jgi:hypothetical protein